MIPAPRPPAPVPARYFPPGGTQCDSNAVHPGKLSDKVSFRARYGNYIGGKCLSRLRPVL